MAENSSRAKLRVSDAVAVPLRGMLLRLRVLEGHPRLADFKPGSMLRLRAPDGREREVTILDHSATGGRLTQKRIDSYGEIDVVVPAADAIEGDEPIEIGWVATTP